ncbi:Intermediate filament protein [Mortierella alpina]|uniref:Intermediate filament protein n=1 Tax=Mortierella alpina TaxID=64518 RepID=A0A9P6M680_MORAP|nr:Intermediate filament protein [Mortierella alpina]
MNPQTHPPAPADDNAAMPAWPAWLASRPFTAIRAAGLTALVLALSWTFGSDTQRRVASLVLATPVVLVLSLFTLAASNVAFSILYARRQRAPLQAHGYKHHGSTTPGQASRHLFDHLRPAKFTRPVAWSNIEKRRRQEQAAKYRIPIADTMPQLSEAMDQVIELIIRDYVAGWMRAITPEVVLQQRIEELLRIVLLRLKARVVDLDLTQLLVTRLVPKVTAHVSDFRKAEMALRGNSLERSLTESDELDLMVAGKFRNGKLHRALSTSISTQASEEAYLRNVVQTILPMLLPKSEVESEILRHLLRELLVGAVLRPVLDLLSDPDYWNQNVDLYIGKAIQEQNMVKKLREALNQHTDNMAESGMAENAADAHATGADLYSFEDFLTMIKRCDSLLDVKRIRNTIITQIRKKRVLIANREKDDIVNGNKVEDIVVYINRLELAKRRAEKRIEALGGPAYPKRNVWDHTPEVKNVLSLIPLDTILTNPSGLSYFMEFQDRRDNMNELQFWLLIDTLNIRGDVDSRVDDDLAAGKSLGSTPSSTISKGASKRTDALTSTSTQALNDPARPSNLTSSILSSRKNSVVTTCDLTDTLREDVRMIYDTYFSESAPRPVVVDHSLVDVFRKFALADGSSSKSVSLSDSDARKQDEAQAFHVRQQLLSAQQQVFDQMVARDYPAFVKTDLYFKFLATYHNSLQESKDETLESGSRSPSSQRSSPGPALFSAMGLASPDKRHDPLDNPKRSSTGSFLDIFGLGRDKDKDKDRDRGHLKRTETSLGNFRPGFLTPSSSRSKPGSPISMRTSDSGASSQNSLQQPQRQPSSKPKQSLEVISASAYSPPLLSRSRSLSSISNPENSTESTHRRGVSVAEGARESSTDPATSERMTQSAVEEGRPTLRNSLLLELQEHGDDDEDDDGDGEGRGGVSIPRMHKRKKKNDNEQVMDAVEAVLSSLMETHNAQPQDLAESGVKERMTDSKLVDVTDPAFSTARDGHTGANALLEWGQTQGKGSRRRFKENSLETGKTVRVHNRDPLAGKRMTLDSVFESRTASPLEKSTLTAVSDDESSGKKEKLLSRTVTSTESDGEVIDQDMAKARKAATQSISDNVQDDVHLAAPGDLLIATRIDLLEQNIKMLRKQEAILEAMIHKVKRKNRPNELRLLNKSKSDLRRDILSKEYQKTQYEVQEEENMIMPGRSTISITSSTVSHDGSKEFALYEIQVFQLDQDGSCASGWVIARRYSEFFALHQQLKEKFPSIVRQYELPGKRGFLKLQKSFVENRRIGLERYLQSLIRHAEICQSQELRAFLSKENVALPQFTASTPAVMPYSFFASDNNSSNEKGAEANPAPLAPSNPFSFEQLFHSTTSPLHSPIASRDPIKSQLLSSHGSEIIGNGAGYDRSAGESGMDPEAGFRKHFYHTLSESLDDIFGGGPPTVLGNITKQLGNQMMLSMEADDEERSNAMDSGSAGPLRKRHGNHGENGGVRLSHSDDHDNVDSPTSTASQHTKVGGLERPPLQRIHSSRNRRLSSPDPHTQHQRLLFQKQQLEVQQQLMPRQQFQPERQQQHPRATVVEPEGVTTFTEPLCDLFIELFELKQKNNWLRRQAVVIILQQVLGGTIERKLRDTIKAYMEENMLTFYVSKLRDVLWPASARAALDSPDLAGYEIINQDLSMLPRLPTPEIKSSLTSALGASSPSESASNKKMTRTQVQKAATKDQASRKLSVFLPELLGNMVGQQNARRGARRVFAAFQNRRLNQQLVYTTLDEVIAAMWPELAVSSSNASPAQAAASLSTTTTTTTAATTTGSHGSSAATTSMTNTTASASTSMAMPPNAVLAASPTRALTKTQPTTDASDSSDVPAAPGLSKTRPKSDARYKRR